MGWSGTLQTNNGKIETKAFTGNRVAVAASLAAFRASGGDRTGLAFFGITPTTGAIHLDVIEAGSTAAVKAGAKSELTIGDVNRDNANARYVTGLYRGPNGTLLAVGDRGFLPNAEMIGTCRDVIGAALQSADEHDVIFGRNPNGPNDEEAMLFHTRSTTPVSVTGAGFRNVVMLPNGGLLAINANGVLYTLSVINAEAGNVKADAWTPVAIEGVTGNVSNFGRRVTKGNTVLAMIGTKFVSLNLAKIATGRIVATTNSAIGNVEVLGQTGEAYLVAKRTSDGNGWKNELARPNDGQSIATHYAAA